MGLRACRVITFSFLVLLAGCAHQTKIEPSNGHIDGVNDAAQPIQNTLPISTVDAVLENTNKSLLLSKQKQKEPTYSFVVNEVPVKEILFALARESKLNIDISPSISGLVTLNAVDQTLPSILERLSRQISMIYRVENHVLII